MRLNLQSRNGMTMVELVSALMIFIFILGALTMALNRATNLWSSSSTGQYEQEKGDFILALLADDLSQAVTDNALLRESENQPPPTFLCDADAVANAEECKIILQFVRHPPYKSLVRDNKPPALEAVFYTYYKNTLFRHAVALEYTNTDNQEHIGKLLEEKAGEVNDKNLHDAIIAYTENYPSTANWEYSLLAERIDLPIILAGIAERYIDAYAHELYNKSAVLSSGLRTLPEYYKMESAVLPDYLFVALRIYNETDWDESRRLADSDDPDLVKRKEPYLGKYFSRRYSFPTMKGARLQ
jgi:hypothetical protein